MAVRNRILIEAWNGEVQKELEFVFEDILDATGTALQMHRGRNFKGVIKEGQRLVLIDKTEIDKARNHPRDYFSNIVKQRLKHYEEVLVVFDRSSE